jgi:broad specificity phosphatase PhoE
MKKDHVRLQRRPFLMPIWLGALAAAVVLSFASWLWGRADSTTVILIRHAEQETGAGVATPGVATPGADPPLSAAGQARAALLAHMFADPGPGRINAIYVTAPLRNRMTAAPLAAALGITPAVVAGDPRDLARRALREHSGGRILIVGHADTMPQIVATLAGVAGVPPIGPLEYGTMYIVTVPRLGRANLLRVDY